MFKRLLSIIMTTVIICSISVVALAAEQDIVTNQDSMNEIIAEINSEYGTNIHILSKEELKKYGLPENTNDNEVNFDSNSFEKELRYIAEVEIPEYDRITKESISGLQSKESTLNYFNTEENTTNISINSASPVTAKKAIKYATAGAKAYIKKNNYGNNVWGTVTNVFCETNMYQKNGFYQLIHRFLKLTQVGHCIGQEPEIIVVMLEENRSIIQVVRSTQNCMLASTLKPSLLTLSLYKKHI